VEEIKTKKVEKYLAYDKEFDTKSEAQKYVLYVEKLLSRDYYEVAVRPDLTEGRGYYDKIIISSNQNNLNSVYQYLMRAYGDPIAFVQNCVPMGNYHLSKKPKFESYEDLKKFLNTEFSVGIGDYRKNKILEAFYVKGNGEGEILNLDEINEKS